MVLRDRLSERGRIPRSSVILPDNLFGYEIHRMNNVRIVGVSSSFDEGNRLHRSIGSFRRVRTLFQRVKRIHERNLPLLARMIRRTGGLLGFTLDRYATPRQNPPRPFPRRAVFRDSVPGFAGD